MGRSILSVRLKKAREFSGLTQLEAAKKLEISNGTLSGYERDYRDPDTRILEKMADLYEVSVDYLLGRSDVKNYDRDDISLFASGGFLNDVPEEKRRKVEAILKILEEEEEKEEKKKK